MQLNMNVILFQAGLLAVQGITYLLVQHTKRPVHDMARPIDECIPLWPQFILIYVLWYPLLVAFPLSLYHYSSGEWGLYQAYIVSIIVDIIISLLVYWFYPTSFTRPKVSQESLSGRLLSMMYIIDYKGLNCMPSMHCSQCFIILYYAFACREMADGLQVLFAGLASAIVASTVFTKQHVLIDVVSALVLAVFCVFAASFL